MTKAENRAAAKAWHDERRRQRDTEWRAKAVEAAEIWFEENDPEGVAFEYNVTA